MRFVPLLSGFVLAIMVGGCATTIGECNTQKCELRITERAWPGVYRVEPDLLVVGNTETQTVGMLWSINDAKARFMVGKNVVPKDGIVYTEFKRGSVGDVTPCYATNDDGLTEAKDVGTKFFCPFWENSPLSMKARYTIRFHDGNGNPRVVDPYVANTGDGFLSFSFATTPGRTASRLTTLSCRDSATCQLILAASADPGGARVDPTNLVVDPSAIDVEITWSLAEKGAYFDYVAQPRDRVEWTDPSQTAIPTCWVTKSPDGGPAPPTPEGFFMRCRVTAGTAAFSQNYSIRFHGADKVQRTASGTVSRP